MKQQLYVLYISCNTLPPNSSKWNKAGGNIDNINDQFCPISENGNFAKRRESRVHFGSCIMSTAVKNSF